MAKSGNCAKCGKQTNFFEKEEKIFCSEKCCYDFFTKDEPRRKEQEKKLRLERWEEIEDEIFFLTRKKSRFGLTEKDLEEIKSLQREISVFIEKEDDKWRKKDMKRELRELKWWEQEWDLGQHDKKIKKDPFTQIKEEIELLKERINELESKPDLTDKEKNWLKNNKQKLVKLEQEVSQVPSSLQSGKNNDKPFNYFPWLIGGGAISNHNNFAFSLSEER